MDINIGACIAPLLYENETVALPGLGSFSTAYQPALIDQVQGELHPPSKAISFNTNLVGDDGLLASYLVQKHDLPLSEAQSVLKDYVATIKERLEKRELAVFPEVGRLYLDYEDKLQFLPDSTNFNTSSYGLPSLNFHPIARTQRPAAKAKPKQAAQAPPPPRKWQAANIGLIAAIGLAVIVLGATVYLLLPSGERQDEEANLQRLPTSRVNVRPSERDAGNSQDEPIDDSLAETDYEDEQAPLTDELEDSERPAVAPGQRSYIIIVGVFSSAENVQRLIDKIYDVGYEPYTEKKGKLTRVGVQRTYRTEQELEDALNDVRNRFTVDAKLYRW